MQRYLIYAVLWSFSGDGRLKMRAELGEYIRRITTVPLPTAPNVPIIDYEVHPFFVKELLLLLIPYILFFKDESLCFYLCLGVHLRGVAILAGQSAPD